MSLNPELKIVNQVHNSFQYWFSSERSDGMDEQVYERLADALDQLPNGFPRTPSNVEIRMLQKIFCEEEAWLAGQLTRTWEPATAVSADTRLPLEEVVPRLDEMAARGLVWRHEKSGQAHYRLAPFVVGIYESHLGAMDHEFAHLVESYLVDGGAAGIMKPQPAIHRVVPAQQAVNVEMILPYDDVRSILLQAKSFRVRDCICRTQQDYVGRKCDFPLHVCMNFSVHERPPSPDDEDITQEEALALLDRTEEIGLVHTVSNVIKGFGYVCNCCGCCCAILRGITEWGIENSVARANYFSVIDPERCVGCELCTDRCQVDAIYSEDGVCVVDRDRCIGCGLCVTGCPEDAAMLMRRPDTETVDPPHHFGLWEQARLENRQSESRSGT